jgi:hypothetical protein
MERQVREPLAKHHKRVMTRSYTRLAGLRRTEVWLPSVTDRCQQPSEHHSISISSDCNCRGRRFLRIWSTWVLMKMSYSSGSNLNLMVSLRGWRNCLWVRAQVRTRMNSHQGACSTTNQWIWTIWRTCTSSQPSRRSRRRRKTRGWRGCKRHMAKRRGSSSISTLTICQNRSLQSFNKLQESSQSFRLRRRKKELPRCCFQNLLRRRDI